MTQSKPIPVPSAPVPGVNWGEDLGQAYELLGCGLQVWSDYWRGVLTARGFDDILRANTEFFANSLELTSLAAAHRQSFKGVTVPTLNEA